MSSGSVMNYHIFIEVIFDFLIAFEDYAYPMLVGYHLPIKCDSFLTIF